MRKNIINEDFDFDGEIKYMKPTSGVLDKSENTESFKCIGCEIDIKFHTYGCPLKKCLWRTCRKCKKFTPGEICKWCGFCSFCSAGCKRNVIPSDFAICFICRLRGYYKCSQCFQTASKNGCQTCIDFQQQQKNIHPDFPDKINPLPEPKRNFSWLPQKSPLVVYY